MTLHVGMILLLSGVMAFIMLSGAYTAGMTRCKNGKWMESFQEHTQLRTTPISSFRGGGQVFANVCTDRSLRRPEINTKI